MDFGERLRELRKQQGLSQRALAALIGVDYTYISKLETGANPPPSAETIHRMAQELEANESELRVLAGKLPIIVCLCGSTRFYEEFHKANIRETLAGKIVLSIGIDFKSDADLLLAGEITLADKKRMDELHLQKINLADEVLILNVHGYIGESTRRELEYAREHDKRIRWLEEMVH